MKLRIPTSQIAHYASRYRYAQDETDLIRLRQPVTRAGYMSKEQLRSLVAWKSPRSKRHVEDNSDQFVREITGFALRTSDERSRIEALTLLSGVLWPTASVVLHMFHPKPYPILDFRALWSVGRDVPKQYDFQFWSDYVEVCRSLALKHKVDMRTLDRALWQYSKERQPTSNA